MPVSPARAAAFEILLRIERDESDEGLLRDPVHGDVRAMPGEVVDHGQRMNDVA